MAGKGEREWIGVRDRARVEDQTTRCEVPAGVAIVKQSVREGEPGENRGDGDDRCCVLDPESLASRHPLPPPPCKKLEQPPPGGNDCKKSCISLFTRVEIGLYRANPTNRRLRRTVTCARGFSRPSRDRAR